MPEAPPVIRIEQGRARIFVWLGIIAVLAGAVALFFFDPSKHGFYPRCFFKLTTGLDCPGCGGLRATHQLLHGHLGAAFALNPLFVVSLPLAALWAARALVRQITKRKAERPFPAEILLWTGGGVVVAFGVLRNVPWRQWMGG
jgi:hypothetical protein